MTPTMVLIAWGWCYLGGALLWTLVLEEFRGGKPVTKRAWLFIGTVVWPLTLLTVLIAGSFAKVTSKRKA